MQSTSPADVPHARRLKDLRALMARHKLSGFIIPRQDEHQGEYVGAYADRLRWLTGFTGSWGVAIAGLKKAAIFVDGRYTEQVRQEVDTKAFAPRHLVTEPPASWIAANFSKGSRIGFDPWITSLAEARRLKSACEEAGIVLVPAVPNLIDEIWHDQPEKPSSPIEEHPVRLAGKSASEKIKTLAETLKRQKADAAFLADPASVAWALNTRASDVPYTPVPLAFAIISKAGKAQLFAAPERLTPAARKALKDVAQVLPPSHLKDALNKLGKARKAVLLDASSAPEHVRAVLTKAGAKIVEGADPCTLPKAQKTKAEQQGARDAQLRDGAALSNFLCWLDSAAQTGMLTELQAEEKLHEFRKATGKLRDLSFRSISAAGPNAALPHYHVSKGQGRTIKSGQIYLIDSGGQYIDGTTDVTRTVIIGKPSAEMADRFTRVLKGMIAISMARFPQGTTGAHIDALARASLWSGGFDFDHGTGHGVGSFLSVHEGPARISKAGHATLQPGMIISNEPGYYKPGHYGIRTENLLLVKEAAGIKGGDRPMLGFETLTFAPIDRRLINASLLTPEESNWLNAYHAQVLRVLSALVSPATKAWLKAACAPLTP